ncbi:MBL fold metallo-hydrolase [Gordonia sp. zg691]|uniref:MBL fold metallo-hydrolase n=1 Tax=Gordonia jinghuaiqii TaxID=2758710 RepID=A0A7D7LSU8_9ACTN|nr:MBL fold metallo-hydrolase [Gordonia jinghuaiqii]MBD0862635.1 MBL fold metallo-hydrolase [Gordonia jinghuaiqii]MCR5976715.1 MBL fold metallo-hydrolase [Gordonia jinghuaiqii]QMS99894.1 MBL fold metallo-hydrolase [Gordonia jinghuaiqii]
MTFHRDVVPGIHWLEYAHTNQYLVEDGDRLVLVDAGLPRSYEELVKAIRQLGHGTDAVSDLIITHGHFDHVGTARRLTREWGLPVHVHHDDAWLAAHPYRYAHANATRFGVPLRHPRSLMLLSRMAVAGAFTVRGVRPADVITFADDSTLPGGAVVVPTPGHTFGHVSLHFPHHDAVISGDALVTLDPYTAATGPRMIAGSATADLDRNRDSLDRLAATGAKTLLPGHGAPWHHGVTVAVERARSTNG